MDTGEEHGTHSRVIVGVLHPPGEKVRDQVLALQNPTGAGSADGIYLVVPAPVTLGQLPGPDPSKSPPADTQLQAGRLGWGAEDAAHAALWVPLFASCLGHPGDPRGWHRVQRQLRCLDSE